MQPLNLDALLTAQRTLQLGGEAYPMTPITARVAMICDAAGRTAGTEQITLMIDAVCALVPTLPREMAENLTVEQIGAVIAHARSEVDAVEHAAGNAPRATGRKRPVARTGTPSAARS